jgi:cytochrome b subunit of formate dehydrogenase
LAKSVHGGGVGLGAATQAAAPGGKVKRHPTCSDCHQGHHIAHTNEAEFRLQLANNCGNCHAAMSSHYALSMHGELTRQGYASAAECADCHGSHEILPIDDPKSQIAPGENRLRTCQKCHVYAVANFTKFDPHANFKDEVRYPTLHGIYVFIQYAVNTLFGFYLLHAFIWFARAVIQRLQFGGHKTLVADKYALPRMGPFHQASYAALVVSFIGLMATGVTLKYSHLEWGKWLAQLFGGFRSASDWHHFFAVVATGTFLVHVGRAVFRVTELRKRYTWKKTLIGPDSLVPNGRDLHDLGRMCLWFIGYSRKPGFERWTYWEKLDYWAFILVACLIGFSGMMLWYPNLFCVVLPGTVLNVAKVVHSQFAIYTASVLLLIHFFHGHFRPEKFPMDLSVITGLVSEQHLRENRPEYIARLEREGRLEEMRTLAPSRRSLWLDVLGGVVVFTLGIGLLVVALLASLGE